MDKKLDRRLMRGIVYDKTFTHQYLHLERTSCKGKKCVPASKKECEEYNNNKVKV